MCNCVNRQETHLSFLFVVQASLLHNSTAIEECGRDGRTTIPQYLNIAAMPPGLSSFFLASPSTTSTRPPISRTDLPAANKAMTTSRQGGHIVEDSRQRHGTNAISEGKGLVAGMNHVDILEPEILDRNVH